MSLKIQPVIGDVGSQELFELRKSYNALLDAIKAAATFAGLQTDIQTTTTKVVKVVNTRELPRPREFPTHT